MKKTVLILVLITSGILIGASYLTLAGPGGNDDGGEDNGDGTDPGIPEGNPAPFGNVDLTQVAKFKLDLISGSEKQPTGGWWSISGGETSFEVINYTTGEDDSVNSTLKNDTKVYKLKPMKEKPKDKGKKKYIHLEFLNEDDEPLGEINVFPPRHDIFNLLKQSEENETRDVILEFEDDDEEKICRWTFFRAFPLKWEGPSTGSGSSGTAMESITLSCEWIELELK